METKDSFPSCSNSEAQQIQQIQDKAKKSCMVSFQQLHSHLKRLSQNDLQGSRTESGFRHAFATLSFQDTETFTGTMFLNVEQLEKQLDKQDFQEIESMAPFNKAVGHNQKSRIQAADQGMMHMVMMQISDPYMMKSQWLRFFGCGLIRFKGGKVVKKVDKSDLDSDLSKEQYDWLEDTDEEVDKQELEAHYSYMAKIQKVPTADSGTDSEPVE
nr:hypothetical protein [Tanacetum cinerariifolium]